ncbi:crotonobetainyl-CoA:carnitine CoA-transferase CaiB-like acyl-CoA transferase [Sinorhizobium americanum]|uniref:Crotonobetainyl-CoA:carnitine CoA-transferase CaiB-like acyl-CoA transferase n=2 Tax=Sinorhizobium americanum TaxID=194963 RepID=A0A4R2B940_9HYPH|nr:crotonobetainyl-CoA:carnitine CoA-transferase CaiB-like acyl-CoA transferase [Sinorhizobium americanum]
MGALAGLRIIEVSQVLAGPFCGYQFALLGAEVIKVELPHSPDCARGRGPLPALNAEGIGLTYQVQGGNKKSLALDFRAEPGRAALLKLVERADVFLENYSTGVLDDFGLGYDDLRKCNPKIVHCSMTGYGETGPRATKGAYDNTIQATSGTIAQCDGQKPGVSFIDYAAGYSAAFAISAALLQRERTGEGCHISASMLEVALSLMAPEAASKQVPEARLKVPEAGISAFDTADGRLMLGAFKPTQYRKLGACLASLGHNIPLLAGVSDWNDVESHSAAIRASLEPVFREHTAEEWQAVLEAADIPAEKILPLEEAVASPQIAARGYFAPSPDDPSIPLPLAAYRMSLGGPMLTGAPPKLGHHNRQILEGLGYSLEEIAALRNSGVMQ